MLCVNRWRSSAKSAQLNEEESAKSAQPNEEESAKSAQKSNVRVRVRRNVGGHHRPICPTRGGARF